MKSQASNSSPIFYCSNPFLGFFFPSVVVKVSLGTRKIICSGILCFIVPPKMKETIYLSSLHYGLARVSVLAFRKILELLSQPLAAFLGKGSEIAQSMWSCSFLSSSSSSH